MRLRKVKNALEKLKKNTDYFIEYPTNYIGKWQAVFQNDHPIHIEIGCGKGQFISNMALNYPEINFIAIEKYDSVLLRCLEKVEDMKLSNLRLIILDATNLEMVFDKQEIDRIYINFSDPWPKYAHRKRRLTYPTFLSSYDAVLKDDGAVYQKTDNRLLFAYSLEQFNQEGWILSNISLDLHHDEVENVTTEFEDKWSKLGPIYRLEATKRKKQ
ncbi:MAG: tRNA (guanosine(46)-N7)-methyltransferase TrmB [Anaeroplasmataceae bacterium]|nr:tRNA (guanosine(46)-N7)-methyltransferase TrmB [Anaeroplasmataceae bacterium]MDE5868091.1 tRNA (guanosine(46)-N7)-methyltransferase TrmB [Anaeroplasmataceae bacterium]